MAAEKDWDVTQSGNAESLSDWRPSDVPSDSPTEDEYVAIADAGRTLRLPEQAIHYYIKKGLLEGKRDGKEWVISRRSVDKFSELMSGPDEEYAWLFQDYNRLLNNYLELIRENNVLSEQVGFLKAKEQLLLQHRNSSEAREQEAQNLRKALVRAKKISLTLQSVAAELEEQNRHLRRSQARGAEQPISGSQKPQDAERTQYGKKELLKRSLALWKKRLDESAQQNQEISAQLDALRGELQRIRDGNEELTQELAQAYRELNEWRNMSFWRRIFARKPR